MANLWLTYNAHKMKFSINDFFSKCEQIPSFLRIWSHLLKISLVENFIFYAVLRSLRWTGAVWRSEPVQPFQTHIIQSLIYWGVHHFVKPSKRTIWFLGRSQGLLLGPTLFIIFIRDFFINLMMFTLLVMVVTTLSIKHWERWYCYQNFENISWIAMSMVSG